MQGKKRMKKHTIPNSKIFFMNKNKTNKTQEHDPWDEIQVKKGKLTGGFLTDALMNAAFPKNEVSSKNSKGLSVVRIRTEGQRIPVRSSLR